MVKCPELPTREKQYIHKGKFNFWQNNCLQGRVPHGWHCLKRKVLEAIKWLTYLQRHLRSMTTSKERNRYLMKRLRSNNICAIPLPTKENHFLLKFPTARAPWRNSCPMCGQEMYNISLECLVIPLKEGSHPRLTGVTSIGHRCQLKSAPSGLRCHNKSIKRTMTTMDWNT